MYLIENIKKMIDQSIQDEGIPSFLKASEILVVANNMISRFGRYHKLLLVLLCFYNFIVGINHTVTSFHTYTPKFYCRDNNDTTCKVNACQGGYKFESEYETLVTEFTLVCSRKFLAPLVNTLYFCGVTAGAIICGTLADVWGRKLIILLCLYIQGILGGSLYFVGNLDIFIIIRTIQGVFVQGLQGVSFALLLEHSGVNNRTGAGCLFEAIWGVGLIYLALCSYFVPSWHNLQIALSIPTVLTLIYAWFIPESISWLITRDRIKSAVQESVKIAKWNKDEKFFNELQTLVVSTKAMKSETNIEDESDLRSITRTSILDMLKNRVLRKHAIIMIAVWFSVTLSYYGILYFLPNLAGERHLNFGIGAAIELISYGVSYVIFSRFGRRWPMVVYQYLTGIFCLIMVVISLSVGDDGEIENHWSGTFNTVLALFAKGFSVSAFGGMYIYAAELIPTECRAAAMGLCGLFSRVGSLIAPQLLVLGDYTFETFPVIVMAVSVLISGSATLYLPETLGLTLPDSIDDVNKLWEKSN